MQFATVCAYPSVSTRLALLFLLAYPFGVLFLSRYRAPSTGPLSASVVPLTLTPLFVGLASAWAEVARVIGGLSIIAHGRAASAAGVTETFVLVTFASAIATLVSGITWIREVTRRSQTQAAGRISTLAGVLAIALPLSVLAAIALQILFSEQLVSEAATPSPVLLRLAVVVATLSTLGALSSLIWLVSSRRNADMQLSRVRHVLALSSLAVAGTICVGSWLLSRLFWSIAVSG
jgi:hypothetical protein